MSIIRLKSIAVLALFAVILVMGSAYDSSATEPYQEEGTEFTPQPISGSVRVVANPPSIQGDTSCPSGTLYEPHSGVCAPINDVRSVMGPRR